MSTPSRTETAVDLRATMNTVARVCCMALVAVLVASATVAAQDPHVAGVIRDSSTGEPLGGALIDVRSTSFQRAARSNQRGEFRVNDVPPGDYRVSVRRIGYRELQRPLRTTNRDTSMVFALTGVVRELDTVRVRSSVTGIHGVVGTAHGLRPIPGATVQVLGVNRPTKTDSSGKFFIELQKPGTYLVRVARAGYAHQLLSIDVPRERSVETATLLDTTDTRARMGTETLWNEFDRRLIWRGPKSALVGLAELDSLDEYALSDALNRSSSAFRRGMRVGSATCVFVNGVPRPGWWVDAFRTERVEAVELYGPGADGTGTLRQAWPPRTPCGLPQGGANGVGGLPAGTAAFAVIWLKQ